VQFLKSKGEEVVFGGNLDHALKGVFHKFVAS